MTGISFDDTGLRAVDISINDNFRGAGLAGRLNRRGLDGA